MGDGGGVRAAGGVAPPPLQNCPAVDAVVGKILLVILKMTVMSNILLAMVSLTPLRTLADTGFHLRTLRLERNGRRKKLCGRRVVPACPVSAGKRVGTGRATADFAEAAPLLQLSIDGGPESPSRPWRNSTLNAGTRSWVRDPWNRTDHPREYEPPGSADARRSNTVRSLYVLKENRLVGQLHVNDTSPPNIRSSMKRPRRRTTSSR